MASGCIVSSNIQVSLPLNLNKCDVIQINCHLQKITRTSVYDNVTNKATSPLRSLLLSPSAKNRTVGLSNMATAPSRSRLHSPVGDRNICTTPMRTKTAFGCVFQKVFATYPSLCVEEHIRENTYFNVRFNLAAGICHDSSSWYASSLAPTCRLWRTGGRPVVELSISLGGTH